MWGKHCIFPYKTLWIATNHFVQSLSFWSPTQLPSWNIGSIIPLVSITYLVLIYNYNNIKYICFINPWQCARCHLVCVCKDTHVCCVFLSINSLPWEGSSLFFFFSFLMDFLEKMSSLIFPNWVVTGHLLYICTVYFCIDNFRTLSVKVWVSI